MTEQFANLAHGTLDADISDTDTSLTLVSATSFPTTGTFRIVVDTEIMVVTDVSGSTFTVTRGAESSPATSHSNGAAVTHVLTAYVAQQLYDFMDAVWDGSTFSTGFVSIAPQDSAPNADFVFNPTSNGSFVIDAQNFYIDGAGTQVNATIRTGSLLDSSDITSILPDQRQLTASDGTTLLLDWSGTSNPSAFLSFDRGDDRAFFYSKVSLYNDVDFQGNIIAFHGGAITDAVLNNSITPDSRQLIGPDGSSVILDWNTGQWALDGSGNFNTSGTVDAAAGSIIGGLTFGWNNPGIILFNDNGQYIDGFNQTALTMRGGNDDANVVALFGFVGNDINQLAAITTQNRLLVDTDGSTTVLSWGQGDGSALFPGNVNAASIGLPNDGNGVIYFDGGPNIDSTNWWLGFNAGVPTWNLISTNWLGMRVPANSDEGFGIMNTDGTSLFEVRGDGAISLDGFFWPTSDGSDTQVLATDGNRNLYWTDAGSGGGNANIGDPVSEFDNDAGYLTSAAQPGDNVSEFNNDAGYAVGDGSNNISQFNNDANYGGQGPQGDQGDKGDQGDQGDPGPSTVYNVYNNDDGQGQSIGDGDTLTFQGTGSTSLSFDPSSRTLTISSDGGGGGGMNQFYMDGDQGAGATIGDSNTIHFRAGTNVDNITVDSDGTVTVNASDQSGGGGGGSMNGFTISGDGNNFGIGDSDTFSLNSGTNVTLDVDTGAKTITINADAPQGDKGDPGDQGDPGPSTVYQVHDNDDSDHFDIGDGDKIRFVNGSHTTVSWPNDSDHQIAFDVDNDLSSYNNDLYDQSLNQGDDVTFNSIVVAGGNATIDSTGALTINTIIWNSPISGVIFDGSSGSVVIGSADYGDMLTFDNSAGRSIFGRHLEVDNDFNVTGQTELDSGAITTDGSGNFTALSYTGDFIFSPGDSGNWDGDPSTVQEAINRMAAVVSSGGSSPIP